jgi:HisJ family histidinol phosphate phosphatase
MTDPRIAAIPDVHGHAKGEHRPFAEERPIAYSARMLFLWFFHACRRASPRFLMVADHVNYLTFEDPGAVNTVRRALKLAQAGDLLGAAETAGVDLAHAATVSEGLRQGMRFSIGAEVDNDPRARPDAQNIVDAMRPDGIIRSVHFVPIDHPEKGPDWPWPFDNEEFSYLYEVVGVQRLWELYMAKLLDDLEKLPGQIAGHFYVPANFGHWPAQKKLEEYEDRLLDVCHRRGIAVEINTRFLYRGHPEERKKKYLEANARLIRKAKARGVGIAIGSDAHSPKDQGNGFDVVLKLLDDAKINELVFPVAGRLARVALRATREHLEAQAYSRRQPTAPGSSITGFSRAELGLPEESEAAIVRREGGRAARDLGPKKRSSDSGRGARRPEATASPAAGTSRRSAESTSSSTKAKATRTAKPAASAKKKSKAKRIVKAGKKRPAPTSAVRGGRKKRSPAKPSTGRPKKVPRTRSGPKKRAARKAAVKGGPIKKSPLRPPAKPKRRAGSVKKSVKLKKKRTAKRR